MIADLSPSKEKSDFKRYGIMTAVLFPTMLALPKSWGALVAMVLIFAVWRAVFHFSTVISMGLAGRARAVFQVVVAVAIPLLASTYFSNRSPDFSMSGAFASVFHLWLLFPVAVIAYAGWFSAKYLDSEHPFRGYLIAATVIFLLCAFGQSGLRFDSDDEDSDPSNEVSASDDAPAGDRYFAQYLAYLLVGYASIYASRRRAVREASRLQ